MGPLFAAVLARALDEWWEELGAPDPFVVVDAGAGRGTMARDLAAAAPACSKALRVVLVERSETLRAQHADAVALEDASWGFVGGSPAEGPLFASLSELPAEPVIGVVVANELLDNLPVILLERAEEEWLEVRVGEEGGRLVEVVVPAESELAAEADRVAAGARVGARIPLEHEAKAWIRHALTLLERGRLVVVDYGAPTAELATRGFDGWFRTYRGHGRGGHPLEDPGSQDLTHDVATDQVARGCAPDRDTTQAEFLRTHGLDDLAAAARVTWTERAHLGDLEAMKARSRISEADALCDQAGLGAFRVLEWQVG